MLQAYLAVGQVLKPQGVRGEVKVQPLTDDPRRFFELSEVFVREREAYLPRAVRCTRVHEGFAYLEFEGVADRSAAEALRRLVLYVDRARAVALPEDAEFICDLIGCEAVDSANRRIGVLIDVLQPGANDVYVLDTPRGELLVPALKRVVVDVDVIARRMVLDERVLDEVAVYTDPKIGC
jgi:16S rRNA processing protein RimM